MFQRAVLLTIALASNACGVDDDNTSAFGKTDTVTAARGFELRAVIPANRWTWLTSKSFVPIEWVAVCNDNDQCWPAESYDPQQWKPAKAHSVGTMTWANLMALDHGGAAIVCVVDASKDLPRCNITEQADQKDTRTFDPLFALFPADRLQSVHARRRTFEVGNRSLDLDWHPKVWSAIEEAHNQGLWDEVNNALMDLLSPMVPAIESDKAEYILNAVAESVVAQLKPDPQNAFENFKRFADGCVFPGVYFPQSKTIWMEPGEGCKFVDGSAVQHPRPRRGAHWYIWDDLVKANVVDATAEVWAFTVKGGQTWNMLGWNSISVNVGRNSGWGLMAKESIASEITAAFINTGRSVDASRADAVFKRQGSVDGTIKMLEERYASRWVRELLDPLRPVPGDYDEIAKVSIDPNGFSDFRGTPDEFARTYIRPVVNVFKRTFPYFFQDNRYFFPPKWRTLREAIVANEGDVTFTFRRAKSGESFCAAYDWESKAVILVVHDNMQEWDILKGLTRVFNKDSPPPNRDPDNEKPWRCVYR